MQCFVLCVCVRFFLLLGLWGSLVCIYVVATSLSTFLVAFSDIGLLIKKAGVGLLWWSGFMLACIFAAAFGIALFILFVGHVIMVLQNFTSIEAGYPGKNPYNVGWRQNLEQLFGSPGFDWLVPIRPRRPLSDGTSFPTNSRSHPTSPNAMQIHPHPHPHANAHQGDDERPHAADTVIPMPTSEAWCDGSLSSSKGDRDGSPHARLGPGVDYAERETVDGSPVGASSEEGGVGVEGRREVNGRTICVR